MHCDRQQMTAFLGSELLQREAWDFAFDGDLPVRKHMQRQMLVIIVAAYAAGEPWPAELFERETREQLHCSLNTVRSHRDELVQLGYITTARPPHGDARRRLVVPTRKGLEAMRRLAEQYARIARLVVERMENLGPLPPLERPEPDGSLEMLDGQPLSLAPDVVHAPQSQETAR